MLNAVITSVVILSGMVLSVAATLPGQIAYSSSALFTFLTGGMPVLPN